MLVGDIFSDSLKVNDPSNPSGSEYTTCFNILWHDAWKP
jgi:hypothetical protein